MLTEEEHLRLSQTDRGTPMGELLRRYWYPVATMLELDEEPTKKVRLLGEDLVLYRDRSGNLGLIGDRCLHRRVEMVFGFPEHVGLRCPYHGWLYDHTGRCLEQPAEDMEAPDSTFKERTIITAYPVEELGGLIWAYLGPRPAPLIPHWDELVRPSSVRSIGWTVMPCNWIQCMENSLDPVHVEYLHRKYDNYILERLGRSHQFHNTKHHKKIGFDVYDYGIIKRRVWHGGTEDDVEWRIGHSILFPNILATGGFEIRVPMDDTHTLQFFYYTRPIPDGIDVPSDKLVTTFQAPLPGFDEHGRPRWDLLDNNSGQDMMAMYTQGPVVDRTQERLGTSDRGIILYRKLLFEQMETVARGDEPMNVFRDPAQNVYLKHPTEEDEGGIAERRLRDVAGRNRTGGAQSYAPIFSEEFDRLLEPAGSR
jgi:5,5'-dehydrodivanillate O-demethylase